MSKIHLFGQSVNLWNLNLKTYLVVMIVVMHKHKIARGKCVMYYILLQKDTRTAAISFEWFYFFLQKNWKT